MERIERDGLTITWLNGGVTHMDGGAMFGVVPKPLWSRKYPHNENNQIELRTDPFLIEKDGYRDISGSRYWEWSFYMRNKREIMGF